MNEEGTTKKTHMESRAKFDTHFEGINMSTHFTLLQPQMDLYQSLLFSHIPVG